LAGLSPARRKKAKHERQIRGGEKKEEEKKVYKGLRQQWLLHAYMSERVAVKLVIKVPGSAALFRPRAGYYCQGRLEKDSNSPCMMFCLLLP